MLLTNPFFLIMLILGVLAMWHANYMHGEPIKGDAAYYNATRTVVNVLITLFFMAGAILWQAYH